MPQGVEIAVSPSLVLVGDASNSKIMLEHFHRFVGLVENRQQAPTL
jgi:hypothetical protein